MWRCKTCGTTEMRLFGADGGWDVRCVNRHPIIVFRNGIVDPLVMAEGVMPLDASDR